MLKTIHTFTAGLEATEEKSTRLPAGKASGETASAHIVPSAIPTSVDFPQPEKHVSNSKDVSNGSSSAISDSSFTLLLINDNAISRQTLSTHLQRKGYSAIEAPDANTAINILRDFSVDLVLLDVTVPETENLTTLQQLRTTYAKMTLPVIVMTANDSDKEIVQAFELGVNDYITKPINLTVVMARIQSQLQLLQSTRQQLATLSQSSTSQVGSLQPSTSQMDTLQESAPQEIFIVPGALPSSQSKTSVEPVTKELAAP